MKIIPYLEVMLWMWIPWMQLGSTWELPLIDRLQIQWHSGAPKGSLPLRNYNASLQTEANWDDLPFVTESRWDFSAAANMGLSLENNSSASINLYSKIKKK